MTSPCYFIYIYIVPINKAHESELVSSLLILIKRLQFYFNNLIIIYIIMNML